MKLPEDKNERNKLYAMLGIFAVAGLYLGFSFGLKPLIEKAGQKTDRIDQLARLIRTAELSLDNLANNRQRNVAAVTAIQAQTQRQQVVIGHSLGNYLLVARSILDTYAAAAGVTLTGVEELTSVTHVPIEPGVVLSKPDPAIARFVAYRVAVRCSTTLVDLVRFVNHCHEQNPLLCITTLTVTDDPGDPQRHNVAMELEWPRWRTEEERIRVTENAAESYLIQLEESAKETR